VAGFASGQTEFSADIVDLQKPGTPTLAKIYFAKDKRRIEMQSASGDDSIIMRISQPTSTKKGVHMQVGGREDAIIMDLANRTSTILWPKQKDYAQAPLMTLTPTELYGLYAFVQPADVDNACPEWMRRKGAEGESCRKVGTETENGRSTVEYELSCYGEVCHLWIDRNLHVLVKRETKWNSTELRNIQEGPQPPGLFDVPKGYSTKTLGGVIRRTEPE
jgi:hypothetical protein